MTRAAALGVLAAAAVVTAGCGGAQKSVDAPAGTEPATSTVGAAGHGGGAPLVGEDVVKRVQASYAQVPGLVLDTRGHLSDGTPVRGRQEVTLQGGLVGPGLVRFRDPAGNGTDAVWDSTGATFSRAVGTACWSADQPFGAEGEPVFAPDLDPGAQASRRADGRIVLVGREKGDSTTWAWVIDPRSYRLISQTRLSPSGNLPAEVGYFHSRGQPPGLPSPTPVCP